MLIKISYTVFPQYLQRISSRTHWDTKIHGCSSPIIAPVSTGSTSVDLTNRRSCIKFVICGWLNLQMWNPDLPIWRVNCIFILKNWYISGPTQFKPVLFKGHL